jgi:hypothetical protein
MSVVPHMARLRHADCTAPCPPSGVTRKTNAQTEFFRFDPEETSPRNYLFRCALSRLGEPSQPLAGTGLLCSLLSSLICFA